MILSLKQSVPLVELIDLASEYKSGVLICFNVTSISHSVRLADSSDQKSDKETVKINLAAMF